MSLMNMVETNNQRIFDAGKIAERDNFWEIFQKGGTTKMSYNNAFSYGRFNDGNYNPKYDILVAPGTATADQMFYNSALTSTKKPIYNECSRLQSTFGNCSQMVEIPYLHLLETTTFGYAFTYCAELVTLIIGGTIGQNGFNVQWSTKLNKASIESIINALSAKESGLTVTLSQTAVNNAFTAEEWEALEATKSNWTISLV